MPELTDYSGPYKHDLKFEDFSKDFLIKLMYAWQRAYLRLNAFWYQAVMERYGSEEADRFNLEIWSTVGEKVVSKFAKIGNFELNTVLDSLKLCQLTPPLVLFTRLPNCHWEYTIFGSVQSTWVSKPSPPRVKYQSALVIPLELMVLDGPPRLLLSCNFKWITASG